LARNRHHFVPQFLLGQWATAGRFVAYFFNAQAGGVSENPKALVASACQIPNLNAYLGFHPSLRHFLETRYLTPVVDTPAARALQGILTDGVDVLTPDQRVDWARFLVSLAVRTPETLLDMGPKETTKAFAMFEAAKAPLERGLSALVQERMSQLEQNFPRDIAQDPSSDPEKLAAVSGMTWWVRRWSHRAILIGDRPLLAYPRMRYPCGIPLNHPSCLIALPIAPTAVFFASADPTIMETTGGRRQTRLLSS
jgi:hypothetical protein